MGFVISYVVLFRDMVPYTFEVFQVSDNLPIWLQNTTSGKISWASIFCFGLLLPISLPRKLTTLRFTTFVSFGISLFIILTIFSLCFTYPSQSFGERAKYAAFETNVSVWGIFNSLPLIIFSYMYQPNIPSIYHDLNLKNTKNLKKLLTVGTGIATLSYIMCGMFGFITFAMDPRVNEIMEEQNILKAGYGGNTTVKICLIGVLFVALSAAPFALLPVKDAVE